MSIYVYVYLYICLYTQRCSIYVDLSISLEVVSLYIWLYLDA